MHIAPRHLVLQVSSLGKEYKLYDTPRDRLRSLITGTSKHRSHWALRDVTFDVPKGSCLGVVGDNGAGKSTLLKLITGTIRPTHGAATTQGRITAILELGAGFHPEFTGRENMYFAGSLIGIDATQMRGLESQIAEFCELGAALDRPVKTYSSGMVVRLAFAVVTAVEPDLLIIDEALAVGDQHFQLKCVARIEAFRQNGCTVLFCSHSLYHIRHLCDHVVWLHGGQLRAFGETEQVLAAYETHVRAQQPGLESPGGTVAGAATLADTQSAASAAIEPTASRSAELVSVTIANLQAGDPPQLMSPDLVVTVVARLAAGQRPSMGVMLEQWRGVGVTSVASHAEGVSAWQRPDGLWQLSLHFPALPLHSGEYVVSAYLFDDKGLVVLDEWKDHQIFSHTAPNLTPGLVQLPHFWRGETLA